MQIIIEYILEYCQVGLQAVGREAGEQPHRKGSGSAGWQQAQSEPAMCAQAAQRANPILGASNMASPAVRGGDYPPVFILSVALPQVHEQFWALQFKRGVEFLKYIQRRVTKLVDELEGIASNEEHLRIWASSLVWRRRG